MKGLMMKPHRSLVVCLLPVLSAICAGGEKPAGFQRVVDTLPTGVAVRVDGMDIPEEAVALEMRPMLSQLERDYADRESDGEYDHAKRVIRGRAIESLIAMRLIGREMEARGVTVTPEQIDRHIEQTAAESGMTLDNLKALVTSRDGLSFEDWKRQMQYDKRLGAAELVKRLYPGKLTVTDEEVRAFYDGHTALFKQPEMVRASHILIRSDTAAGGAADLAARARAEEILEALGDGADFAQLARARSDCPSAEKGGDLGFAPADAWVPQFAEAAFALAVGQTSGIVTTPYGYHIIRLTDRRPAGQTPFDEARERIGERLRTQKQSRLRQRYLGDLYEQARIEYAPGNLITLVPLLSL